MTQRVYIDTSVVGGCFDEEFKEDSLAFFEMVLKNEIIIIASEVVTNELVNAPYEVKYFLESLPIEKVEWALLSEEAINLADHYIEAKVIGKTSRADCHHIAIATVSQAHVLISWNFKHIVNLPRIRGYNSVNLKLGYPMIEIRSPKELLNYEST